MHHIVTPKTYDMKTPVIIISLLFFLSPTHAQYNPVASMQNEFKDIATFSKRSRQSGFEGLQSYKSDDIKGSQFFYPEFTRGSVTTTNNETFSSIYQFLFDKVRQELFIIAKDDKTQPPEVLLAEKAQIKTFTITTDKDHVFVPARNYDATNTTDFYEVLRKNDSSFTLLKCIKTTFVKMDTRDLEKMKRGEMYDEFVDKINYYISFKSGKPQPVSFKKKSIINAFPDSKKSFIENYLQDHSQDDIDEQYLIKIADAVNN